MFRVTVLTAVVALGSSIALGYIVDTEDPVDDRLETELWELHQKTYKALHHAGHHRHHSPKRFLGLVRQSSIVAPAKAPTGPEAQLLPGRNQAVTTKLHEMKQELSDLKSRKESNTQAHASLEGQVVDAMSHMNSVVLIKSQLAKTEVELRNEERKLKKLGGDRLHLDATHKTLTASLHHIMQPKIGYAESRKKKKAERLLELQAEEENWRNKRDELHAASLAMLEERRTSKENLEAAIVAEEKAHQERKADEKQYRAAKKKTIFDIQSYKYSDTKERASATKRKRGEEEARQAEVSVQRLKKISDMEEARVDNSMAHGQDKVSSQIQEMQDKQIQSKAKLEKLKSEYVAWQEKQQQWASKLKQQGVDAEAASTGFTDSQENVLSSARDQVVLDAEADSDWEGWDDESDNSSA